MKKPPHRSAGVFHDRRSGRQSALGADYSALTVSASDTFDGTDDSASSGMFRVYGRWNLTGDGSGNSGLPVFELDDSGPAAEFKVEFVRRKGSGLVYTAKRSFDLGAFAEMSGAVTVTPIDDQFERVEVSEPCDPSTTPRCFGYVEVTVP